MSGSNVPPALTVSSNGIGVVPDALLNSFMQAAALVANLRSFQGIGNMNVWLCGTNAPNDGGQGVFIWSGSATAADDDGATTIAPYGLLAGRWLRQSTGNNVSGQAVSENFLVNSGCTFDQVLEGGTYTVPTNGSQTATSPDCWDASAFTLASGLTLQRSGDAPGGLLNSIQLTVGTGAAITRTNDGIILFQNLNNTQINSIAFGQNDAKITSVAFWIKSHGVTGNYSFALQNGFASRGFVTSFDVPVADVWQLVNIGPIPADSYGAGTAPFTANTTASTTSGNVLTIPSAGILVGAMISGTNIPSSPPTYCDEVVSSTQISLSADVSGTVSSGETITISPPWTFDPSNNILATFTLTLSAGTGFQGIAGAWQTTPPIGVGNGGGAPLATTNQTAQLQTVSGAYVRVSGMTFQIGSQAVWEQEDPAYALIRVQQFIQKSYEQSVAVGVAAAATPVVWCQQTSGTFTPSIFVPFRQEMLLNPSSVTIYSANSGASGKVYDGNSASDVAATAVNIGPTGFTVQTNAPLAQAPGALVEFQWLAETSH